MPARFAVGKPETITTDIANEHFNDVFRRHVGRGKPWLPDEVARLTGIPIKTIESYRNEKAPQNANLLKLCAVLGPAFASDYLAIVGMAVGRLEGDTTRQRVRAEVSRYLADDAEAEADGVVTHTEQAKLDEDMERIHRSTGEYLAAKGRKTFSA